MKRATAIRKPVLLVDDEEQLLATCKLNLEIAGLGEVLTLSASREVLPLLAARPVAAMVLDLSMPNVSGLELLTTVNRDFPHVPIIVMTATDEVETVVECMKLGAFDYLVKPVNTNRLVATVKKAL